MRESLEIFESRAESRTPTVMLMSGCTATRFETKIMLVVCSSGGGAAFVFV